MRVAAIVVNLVALAQVAALAQGPELDARLQAAHEAVSPGGRSELVLELKLEPGWHVYHPATPSSVGISVSFEAPPGVQIGQVRFPRPRLAARGGIETLELSGRVLLLAPLALAADVPAGGALPITARLRGIACKELCLPVEASASLRLTVRAQMGRPAHQRLFRQARAQMPLALHEAPYLRSSRIGVEPRRLKIGQPAEVVALLKVQPGHHIQDREPGVAGLIGSRLFIEKIDGLQLGRPVWPPPRVRQFPGIGKVREQSGELRVRVPLKLSDQKFAAGPVRLRALLQYQACNDQGQCYPPEMAEAFVEFVADTPNPPASVAPAAAAPGPAPDLGSQGGGAPAAGGGPARFILMVVFGFLGGLILNVTPCVLPVVSIKVLSFVQQAGEDPKRVFRLGLAFCAGILVWFWLFAALSALGNVPLQNPWVVLAVGSVVFVLALSLLGVFEIVLPGGAAGRLDAAATSREGYAGSFFKGFLATLLGTACTAPFLATALTYTFTQPALVGVLIFSSAGLGMASPYLLLSAKPGWLRFVPKPGPWMVTFKQAMGFVLLGTGVWLLWILRGVLGGEAVVWTVAFWGFLALAAWLLGKIRPSWSAAGRLAGWAAALAVGLIGWWFCLVVMFDWQAATRVAPAETAAVDPAIVEATIAAVARADWSEHIPWQPWHPGGLAAELSRRGYTVYVDYTADWCPSCKANKYAWLEREPVRARMRALRVIPIEADFTRRNPSMHAEIKSWGNPTVPLNVVYPAGHPERAIKLPTVFVSAEPIYAALEKAGPSRRFPARLSAREFSAAGGGSDGD